MKSDPEEYPDYCHRRPTHLGAIRRDARHVGADFDLAWLCIVAFCNGGTLEGASVDYVDLNGANLCGANLAGVRLVGADFYRANLSGANLSGANLSGAHFYGAEVCFANLTGANLTGANFSGTNLCGVNLFDANFRGADLTGAYITGTKFVELKFKLELKLTNNWKEKRDCLDCLLNNEIHQFKNWYIKQNQRILECFIFSFENENDATMAKMLLE